MAGSYLLDTNIIIGLLGGDPDIAAHLEAATEIFSSVVVIGELYFGAFKSRHVEHNIAQIEAIAGSIPILPCDLDTAKEYGKIKSVLKRKGRPIPENDIWIAAQGIQHNLITVTRDQHFTVIDGLSCQKW